MMNFDEKEKLSVLCLFDEPKVTGDTSLAILENPVCVMFLWEQFPIYMMKQPHYFCSVCAFLDRELLITG
jgi:hypothetical protein